MLLYRYSSYLVMGIYTINMCLFMNVNIWITNSGYIQLGMLISTHKPKVLMFLSARHYNRGCVHYTYKHRRTIQYTQRKIQNTYLD